jgi:PIN domain nuclease of toxin-antitoxin system
MRLLLDTHILLWALGAPERLSAATRMLVEDPANEVLFSAASIWEIAIKASRGRPDFHANPGEVATSARNVSTKVRQPVFEIKLERRAFGSAD